MKASELMATLKEIIDEGHDIEVVIVTDLAYYMPTVQVNLCRMNGERLITISNFDMHQEYIDNAPPAEFDA